MNERHRKPRLLIAGEFSAGKTQLINGLLDQQLLPSNVTSTSLPPIWLSQDHSETCRVGLDGSHHPLQGFENVPIDGTAFCQVAHDAPFLEYFDVIDTPGNSDPNIPAESWMRMLDYADAVLWCTNATQAWRQSEKAVWKGMNPRLHANSTLLITHADRLPDAETAVRLERRVYRDASEHFSNQMLVSLIDEQDLDRIADHLLELAGKISLTGTDTPTFEAQAPQAVVPQRPAGGRIMPRRVSAMAAAKQAMPAPQAAPASTPTPAPAAAHASAPTTAQPTRPIRPVRAKRPAAPQNVVPLFEGSSSTSKAEAIWALVSKGRPLNTADDFRACLADYAKMIDIAFEEMEHGPAELSSDVRHSRT